MRIARVALCAGVAALLYFTGLGRPALWEPDEGRYAEVAREMLFQGDYVTPRNDWVRYFEKPPLVYWATAGAIRVFGVNEFAARAPAALFSTGQVAVTEALGEAMFGPAAGVMAAVALALSPLFFSFARFATPDPALAFFFTAALASFFMAARSGYMSVESGSFMRGAGRNWMVLAAAMLGLGTLAKGPVALALGGAIALVWLLAEGRARDAFAMPWLSCAIVYLAIAVPWFVLAAARNPGFLQFFFVHEHIERYLESTEHEWGPYFFAIVVAGGMWPWLFFAPLGLHDLRSRDDDEPAITKRSASLLFLLTWFGLVFVFFSIPRSKLGEYILPGFPPLAIISGYGLSRLAEMPRERIRHLMLGFVMLNAALAVAMALAAPTLIRHGISRGLLQDAAVAGFGLLAGAAGAAIAARFHRSVAMIAVPIAVGVLIAMGALMKAREDAAPMYSYRTLARAIRPLTNAGCVIASYRHQMQSLPFYTRHREKLVAYRGELAPFADSPDARASFISSDADLRALWVSNACVALVANRSDLPRLRRLLTPTVSIIGCEGKKVALYNQHLEWWPTPPDACDGTSE